MKHFVYLIALLVAACSDASTGAEIFQKEGLAINGYDPVAFFSDGTPVKGTAQYRYQWKDATWSFASQAHLDSFKRSPNRYAPQYGGYCAYGIADGHKAPTEAATWTIENGKLYFNYNNEVKQLWNKNRSNFITTADKNWQQVKFEN